MGVRLIVENRTGRDRVEVIQKPHFDNLRMQRHIAPLARLGSARLGCNSCDGRALLLPEILAPKLRDLGNPCAGKRTKQGHPSLSGGHALIFQNLTFRAGLGLIVTAEP